MEIIDSAGGAHYALSLICPEGIDRDDARLSLFKNAIETSVYYPVPVPLLTYYRRKYGYVEGQFPVAERISSRSITLPIGPHMSLDALAWTARHIKEAFKLG